MHVVLHLERTKTKTQMDLEVSMLYVSNVVMSVKPLAVVGPVDQSEFSKGACKLHVRCRLGACWVHIGCT